VTSDFKEELRVVINRHSVDNKCETPDYILTEFLYNMILQFALAVKLRDIHEGRFSEKETK